MATKLNIPGLKPPSPFHIEGNTAANWRLFKQRWETYALLTGVSDHDDNLQVALFTSCLADDALQVFNGFSDKKEKVADIIKQFDTFAVGEMNVIYERFLFNKRIQVEGKSFEQFVSDLRNMSQKCDFCTTCVDSLVRDRIVLGIADKNAQTELLKKKTLPLQKCIDICRASESAMKKANVIRPSEEVNLIKQNSASRPPTTENRECKFCGGTHPFKREACPAYNRRCNICKKLNHFARKCNNRTQPRQIRQVTDSADEDFVYAIQTRGSQKEVNCRLNVNGTSINFLIDTGATELNTTTVCDSNKTIDEKTKDVERLDS